jgi:predicted HicB family RNase H-like nuclease
VNTHFEYKGYLGSAEVDVEDGVLVGKLLCIRDTITYSADAVQDLEKAFHEAVDEYLASCAAAGEQPDVPFKGSFNVRVGPELHREAAIVARRNGVGLNEFVCEALTTAVSIAKPQVVHHLHDVTVTVTGETWTATTTRESTREFSIGTAKH